MNKKTKTYVQLCLVILIAVFSCLCALEMNAQTVDPSPPLGSGGSSAQCQISGGKGVNVNINGVAECVENRYGFDKDALRRSKKKESAPLVEIQFSNTDPVEGEKVTAMAIPTHFTNQVEDLYFTWSLVHFDNGRQVNSTYQGIHEAMSIVARGNFDPCLWGVDTDCDGTYDVADTDDDGFFAPMGGRSGVGAKGGDSVGEYDDEPEVLFDEPKQIVRSSAITRCYEHNFGKQIDSNIDNDSGRDRIVDCMHKFYNCPGAETGDGVFGLAEEQCWGTNPQNPDTDGDGVRDEADVAGLGQNELTWTYRKGDRVGLWVEGTSMIPINEGGIEMEAECEYSYELGTATTYEEAMEGCRVILQAMETEGVTPEHVTTTVSSSTTTGSETTSSGTTVVPEQTETTDYTDVANIEADYDTCVESITQVCEREGLDFDDLDDEAQADAGRTNAYYKIMWASPAFDEEDGFYYMHLVSVDEKGEELLDPELEAFPLNPQFEQANPSRSDLVIVSAAINNKDVDDAFLDYEWSVRLCEINDPFECPEDVTDELEYETFTNGLGVKKLIFRPTAGLFSRAYATNKAWLKVSVIVTRHGEYIGGSVMDPDQNYFPIGAVDHVMVPVTRNDMNIRLFRAVLEGGVWTLGPEICADGLYQDICPLYPNEILAAQVVAPTGNSIFAWQINSFPLRPPFECVFSAGCEQYGPTVFFTVDQAAKSTGVITVTANRNGSNELISERMYAVYNPLAVINSANGATRPLVRFDGTAAEDIFEASMGSRVAFRIDELVPNYIDFSEINIEWYLNGEQVYDGEILRPEYLDNHGYLNVAVSADRRVIEFDLDGKYGTGYEVKARIERPVPPEEIDVLERAWRILDAYNLTQDRSISVKVAYEGAAGPTTSLRHFFASSFMNAPEYLIFVIRLALAMVMIWSVFFGISYAIRLNGR